MDEPLLGADAAAGHLAADHEAPGLVLAFLRALRAQVAVVLLVAAVELEQDVRVLGNVAERGVRELFGDLAAEAVGGEFDVFDGGFAHGVGGIFGGEQRPECHEIKKAQVKYPIPYGITMQ